MSAETAGTIPAPTDIGALANRINFHTRDAHNKINAYMSVRLAFALKHGFIYRQGILAYYHIFDAIEQEIDRLMMDPQGAKEVQVQGILRQFWLEEFRRSGQIFKDLEVLYSPEYRSKDAIRDFVSTNRLPPVLQDFVDYIHTTIQDEPCNVLAYCHVMYLALFAGGRVMRSNLYRHTGLFPKFEFLSPKELVHRGTNFFTFSDEGTDAENRLRWKYKQNFELATRNELSEEQKHKIIQVSSEIFLRNMAITGEIGELNKQELMSKFSFKLLTYFVEEWKYSALISKKSKDLIIFTLVALQFLLGYYILRRFL
ncbi:hypothetical protein HG535_0E05100 [Zygotorulaspora mrakii]|uniref:Heme oxygenase n=1 Tax=Zygotorulaspora mrakii TaxID=42260 RepID=A0A7H9B4X4_ZYGMR|nr:uncharacterized protein HG535_0E05100 [Zygotorulaspora mrakii]QLG73426.1 hypothetical protein HG535_0E05100 [Zygotorulaspora mrakii]